MSSALSYLAFGPRRRVSLGFRVCCLGCKGWEGLRVQEFKGLRFQEFKGLRVQVLGFRV